MGREETSPWGGDHLGDGLWEVPKHEADVVKMWLRWGAGEDNPKCGEQMSSLNMGRSRGKSGPHGQWRRTGKHHIFELFFRMMGVKGF